MAVHAERRLVADRVRSVESALRLYLGARGSRYGGPTVKIRCHRLLACRGFRPVARHWYHGLPADTVEEDSGDPEPWRTRFERRHTGRPRTGGRGPPQ